MSATMFSTANARVKGYRKLYSYRGGTTVEDRELDLLAEAVIMLPVEETTSIQLESY